MGLRDRKFEILHWVVLAPEGVSWLNSYEYEKEILCFQGCKNLNILLTIIFSRIQLGGGKEIQKQILPAGFQPRI